MRTVRLVGLRAAFALAGAVLCLASLLAYRHLWRVGELPLPWGLVLAVVATYLGVRAAALLDGTPAGATCCAVGWAAVLFYLFNGRSEGDYLLAADWLGYTMILAGLLAAGAGVLVSMGGPRTGRSTDRA